MSYADYRPWLPGPEQSRIAGETAEAHTAGRLQLPRARTLFSQWAEKARLPFTGITTDGTVRPGLFELRDEAAPSEAVASVAHKLIDALTPEERQRTLLPLDSGEWRHWQNTEMYVEKHGLRLEYTQPRTRALVLEILRASLSDQGYANAVAVMQLNAFLGALMGAPGVLGEWSYNFVIYGRPSTAEPWGWQLWGHHLALNCLLIGRQMVLTPCFLGAEVCYADTGPFAGLTLFQDHERLGLELMNSLSAEQQAQARVGWSLAGDDLPEDRVHFADYLMLGGAYQDNRIVPHEGAPAAGFKVPHRNRLMDLVEQYIGNMPDGPRQAKMEEFERHLGETHFCWVGGSGPDDPFYYRIQSPVTFIEFDQHPGLFLTNKEPLKFHVHTVVRTPNGNDYGIDLLRQHYRHAHRHGGEHDHDHDHS